MTDNDETVDRKRWDILLYLLIMILAWLGVTALNALQQSTALVDGVVEALPAPIVSGESDVSGAMPPSDEELAVAGT